MKSEKLVKEIVALVSNDNSIENALLEEKINMLIIAVKEEVQTEILDGLIKELSDRTYRINEQNK